MIEPNKLSPFRHFCITIGALPSSYMESMSYYEMLEWLCKYLKDTVVPTVNNNANALEELQQYVEHYFDSLDIQQEIDNKLDEMAESGQLTDIIAQYLQLAGVLAYDTVADMKNADNLVDGSICKTIGKNSYNDGEGSYYKIRPIQVTDIIDEENIITLQASNTLIAEKIINKTLNLVSKSANNTPVTLQTMMYYDLTTGQHVQGACMHGTKLYCHINSNIYVFENNQVSQIIPANFGHANDLVYLNEVIYGAGTDDKKLYRYNLATGVNDYIDPFSNLSPYTSLFGIEQYDENHIICYLGYKKEEDNYINEVSKMTACILNMDDLTYKQITLTNTKNYYCKKYAVQGCSYRNGKLFISFSEPNCIYEFVLNGNTANLERMYNIPFRDKLGLNIGENEGFSAVTGDVFLFTSYSHYGNSGVANFYLMGLQTEVSPLPVIHSDLYYASGDPVASKTIYCDINATSLYQDGSVEYPFSNLTRALLVATRSEIYNKGRVQVAGGTYKLETLFNLDHVLMFNKPNEVVTIDKIDLAESSLSINPGGASQFVIGNIQLSSSNLTVRSNEPIEVSNQLKVTRGSTFKGSVLFTGTTNQPAVVENNSLAEIRNYGVSYTGSWANAKNGGVIITNRTGATFDGGTVIYAGTHNAD